VGKTIRRALAAAAAAVAVGGAIALLRPARGPGAPAGASADEGVRAACSGCHAFPPPDVLPRSVWRPQIEHMSFLAAYLSEPSPTRAGLSLDEIVAWYEERAPESLPFEPAQTRDEPGPLAFERRSILLGERGGPGVATVERVDPAVLPGLEPRIAASHMANGSLHLFSLTRGPRWVGDAGHPARIATGDLDRDGRIDLVVSDLGDPMPSDDPVGRVLIARSAGEGRFELATVLEGVGRVADAKPLDLDGDGDLDLAVAAFGWMRSGGIFALRNETPGPGELRFRPEQLSPRAGAVSVVALADPGAGFATAFSQHHELVSAFRPAGEGFEERELWRAPHPNWGTSHLSAADLDRDGDEDFLLAHGDTLDDGVAFKPWHGVEWLENRGAEGFTARRIGALYGAHAAEAADLDGDGDLDVVACGFLPQVELPVARGPARVDSVVWFERRGEEWIPWAIEINHPRHTGLTVVDLDGDGRLDVVAAINRAWDATAVESGPSLEVWLNRGAR
jgi:hypothetical protein